MRRLCRIGTSERHSAPPAIPTSTWPSRIADATSAIAWFAEAQARFTVWAGTDFGRPAPRADLAAEVRGLHGGDDLPHDDGADRAGVDLRPLDELAHAGPGEVDARSGPGTPSRSGRRACGTRRRSRLFGCSWGSRRGPPRGDSGRGEPKTSLGVSWVEPGLGPSQHIHASAAVAAFHRGKEVEPVRHVIARHEGCLTAKHESIRPSRGGLRCPVAAA